MAERINKKKIRGVWGGGGGGGGRGGLRVRSRGGWLRVRVRGWGVGWEVGFGVGGWVWGWGWVVGLRILSADKKITDKTRTKKLGPNSDRTNSDSK